MKTSLLKLFFAALFLTGFTSCSKDDGADGDTSELAGEYIIVSMTSNIPVDLNNDGIASTNLMDELGAAIANAESPDLEIKPVLLDNELVQVMSFNLPHPNVDLSQPDMPTVEYSVEGMGYQYKYDKSTNKITVEGAGNNGPVPAPGRLETIEVTEEGDLDAVITKYYYDFATGKWIQLTITCEYEQG
jgi:hypothetical protein